MSEVYTVCFCGTDCSRDEGEITKPKEGGSHKVYNPKTGYIPVRMHLEINDATIKDGYVPGSSKYIHEMTKDSHTVRGVAQNDFYTGPQINDRMVLTNLSDDNFNYQDPTKILSDHQSCFTAKNEVTNIEAAKGKSMVALALHGANLAAAAINEGKKKIVFLGHSRGGVECITAASLLHYFGTDVMKKIPVYIFAIDPVPGPGEWYSLFTQLTPNVEHYVGVYAWDCLWPFFAAVVPSPKHADTAVMREGKWKGIGDDYAKGGRNPILKPGKNDDPTQPSKFDLYLSRGGHGTVAGNYTNNAFYNPADVDTDVGAVSEIVYIMARAYLTEWGVQFKAADPLVTDELATLRTKISTNAAKFDNIAKNDRMKGLSSGTSREVSSQYGRIGIKSTFPAVVGDIPKGSGVIYNNLDQKSKKKGWVRWNWL